MRTRASRGSVIAVGDDDLVREIARRQEHARTVVAAGDLFAALALVANASSREPVAAIVIGPSGLPRTVIEEAVHRLDPSVEVIHAERPAVARTAPPVAVDDSPTPHVDVVTAAIDDARETLAERERTAADRARTAAPAATADPAVPAAAIDAAALGDVDLVAAVLAGPGRVVELALALVRHHLGHGDVRLAAERTPTGRAAEIRHDDRPLGSLVSETADVTALATWARWIGPWLALDRRFHDLHEQAFTDELTGAGNRRAFERILADEIANAKAARRPLTLMVFDIDDFKRYNDDFGHDVGDEVLKETVALLRSVIRRGDHVFRIGGDEFVVIFADDRAARGGSPPESIEVIADRFRRAVNQLQLARLGKGGPGRISISAGVATFPWDGLDGPTLLAHADRLAIQSKRSGKNTISFGPGSRGNGSGH